MRITSDGVVVRQRNIGERDRLITVLTRDQGMITAYANGARAPRSPLASSTELLTYSNFVLFEYKGRVTVDAASAEQVFFGIRQDVELLALGAYLAQLCAEVLPEGEQDPQCLRLLLNSLYLLNEKKRTPDFIKPVFELRLLALSGFMPDLVACRGCGCYEHEAMYFLPQQGELCCGDCLAEGETGALPRAPGVLAAMRYILYSDFEKLFAFSLPDQGLRQLSAVSQTYLLTQLEREFPALTFYQSVRMPAETPPKQPDEK